ncbi:MAG: hypothetical protein ACRER8_09130, partial [Pseudomonas sp.]|uniref:hypothetical protein n=1 Tax=Pseudomonas sp. TaxID=306 RepID=UPI003D6E7318
MTLPAERSRVDDSVAVRLAGGGVFQAAAAGKPGFLPTVTKPVGAGLLANAVEQLQLCGLTR